MESKFKNQRPVNGNLWFPTLLAEKTQNLKNDAKCECEGDKTKIANYTFGNPDQSFPLSYRRSR